MVSKIKTYLLLLLPFAFLILLSYYLQAVVLDNQEELSRWLVSFGPYVILVYIILQFLTIVFAPLGGFVLVVMMIALFGPGLALTLAYLVTTPAYLLNFYLGRKYGRPLVKKIIGEITLKRLDLFVQNTGTFTLVILRLLQGGYFDYLSYGFGLTKIPFKTFAIVNFTAGIPGVILTYFIFTSFDSLTTGVIISYLATALLTLIFLSLKYLLKKH